ncbi:hypothetical protein Hsar01_02902 [Haloferula sargassicola]|uniref:Outer membrane beta-barrel protein n=2 Tax=Haloferula sargassicola TaxID=490096 RepID=A0ABP9UQ53_9BACT
MAFPLTALAQDFAEPIPVEAPSGFQEIPGTGSGAQDLGYDALTRDFLDGLSYQIGTSLFYDSNVTNGSGLPGSPEIDDTAFSVSPSIAYRTQGSEWWFAGNLGGSYAAYFDNSNFNASSYRMGLSGGYKGAHLSVTGNVGMGHQEGANRYAGAYVEEDTFNAGINASYSISPKTSLRSSLTYSKREGGAFVSETEETRFDLSALWKATPLLRVGPGIGWSYSDGARQVDRSAVRPSLNASYQLAKKVSMTTSLGVEFVEYGGVGGSDTTFSGSLGLNYQANAIWGLNLQFYSGTQADGYTPGAYRETTSVRLGYHHKIRRAMFNAGVRWESSDLKRPAGGAILGSSQDYFGFDASLGIPVFSERAFGSLFYQWSDQDGVRSFQRNVVGVSLTSRF